MEEPSIERLLNRHRDSIHLLPGVVGTGIGFSSALQSGDQIMIQVFVELTDHVGSIRKQVKRMLGDVPFEVIVTGVATAGDQTDR